MYVIGKLSKYNDERRVVQYSQIDSIGVSGDKNGVHWYQWKVPTENHVIPIVLLDSMHLIKGT